MSKCSFETALNRIKSATKTSPIVVYRNRYPGFVECFFLTAATRRRMKFERPLGVYSNDMDMEKVGRDLSIYCKR